MAESDGLTHRDAAAQIGELVADLCDERRRADLASAVRALLDQLASPARVIVTGEFKQGKSSLVNALCGQPVCPVDDDVATAIPTIVRYEPESTAAAIFTSETADLTERKPLEFEDLPAWIREDGQQVTVAGLTAVDVALPSTLLRSGLTLIDMPGTGGMATPQAAMALAAVLPTCDAAVVVSDAGQPVTASEAEHVETIRNRLDAVLVTKTKIDIHRTWEVVVALDDQTFRALDVPVIGISAELARRARASQDRELAVESRLPEVSVWLQRVAGETRDRTALGVVAAALEACAHVATPLEQEAATLRDPAGHAERAAQLEAATAEATRLRGAASRWQQVLGDAMGDITTDLGDDLRSRFRGLITAAEEALDQADPATVWVEFEPELRRLITTAASDYQLAVHDRLVACRAARRGRVLRGGSGGR